MCNSRVEGHDSCIGLGCNLHIHNDKSVVMTILFVALSDQPVHTVAERLASKHNNGGHRWIVALSPLSLLQQTLIKNCTP